VLKMFTVMKIINDAVQIVGRGIAFVIGILLLIPCFIITFAVSIICKVLWSIAFVPSWISGRLIMFAMDLDPADIKKQCEMSEDLDEIKKVIKTALAEAKEKADNDPS